MVLGVSRGEAVAQQGGGLLHHGVKVGGQDVDVGQAMEGIGDGVADGEGCRADERTEGRGHGITGDGGGDDAHGVHDGWRGHDVNDGGGKKERERGGASLARGGRHGSRAGCGL